MLLLERYDGEKTLMRVAMPTNLRNGTAMENNTTEVRYDEYCVSCKHFKDDEQVYEYDGPCNKCLNTPVRLNSSQLGPEYNRSDEPKSCTPVLCDKKCLILSVSQ